MMHEMVVVDFTMDALCPSDLFHELAWYTTIKGTRFSKSKEEDERKR